MSNIKKWEDQETFELIDLFEVNPCLWEIRNKDYQKRDKKEVAYNSIAEKLGVSATEVRKKWESLRAYHGRELAREKKEKSGQSVEESYVSNWTFFDKLNFLNVTKSRGRSIKTFSLQDTIATEIEEDETSFSSQVEVDDKSKKNKRKQQNEPDVTSAKVQLLDKCASLLERPSVDKFALYVSEKLGNITGKRRLLLEKSITDLLLQAQIEELDEAETMSNASSVLPFMSNNEQSITQVEPPTAGYSGYGNDGTSTTGYSGRLSLDAIQDFLKDNLN